MLSVSWHLGVAGGESQLYKTNQFGLMWLKQFEILEIISIQLSSYLGLQVGWVRCKRRSCIWIQSFKLTVKVLKDPAKMFLSLKGFFPLTCLFQFTWVVSQKG